MPKSILKDHTLNYLELILNSLGILVDVFFIENGSPKKKKKIGNYGVSIRAVTKHFKYSFNFFQNSSFGYIEHNYLATLFINKKQKKKKLPKVLKSRTVFPCLYEAGSYLSYQTSLQIVRP